MTNARLKRVARRTLRRAGRDVTLRNYFVASEDDYGENYDPVAGSPFTVTARVERSTAATPNRDAFGADVEADVEIFVESGTSAAAGLSDGAGDGASEIDVDGQTYVVLQLDDQDNGLLRLLCVRAA